MNRRAMFQATCAVAALGLVPWAFKTAPWYERWDYYESSDLWVWSNFRYDGCKTWSYCRAVDPETKTAMENSPSFWQFYADDREHGWTNRNE